jgi:hypothetical protein
MDNNKMLDRTPFSKDPGQEAERSNMATSVVALLIPQRQKIWPANSIILGLSYYNFFSRSNKKCGTRSANQLLLRKEKEGSKQRITRTGTTSSAPAATV